MPELPEVEAVCRKLREEAAGQVIRAAHILRPRIVHPQSVDEIERTVRGRRIEAVERRAKNILMRLSGGIVMRVHLRMTGNLYVAPDVRFRPPSARAYFEFDGHRGMVFEDFRALGRIHLHSLEETERFLSGLGPEPLAPGFTIEAFQAAAKSSRQPAKLFLMDQTRIAGLGNIYAAEALFRARVNPSQPINRFRGRKLGALHGAIVQVLEQAVASALAGYGGPGTIGEAEAFERLVYDREGEPCGVCGRKIRRIRQGGRSTYYCPGCQR